jgi:hypothetical protein
VTPRNLSNILWQERQLVGQVEDGTADRLTLQLMDLDRAIVVDGLAQTFALDRDVTLRDLASRLPAPWPEVFITLHESLSAADAAVLPRSLTDFLR